MKTFKEFLNKKTSNLTTLAKKHKIDISFLFNQLRKGISIEKEHTSHEDVAREIALDHLGEDPHYYDKLAKMEKK
jgi:hypothetical protein